MKDKAKAKKLAKSLGATIEESCFDGDSVTVDVDAPEGKQFQFNGLSCFVCQYWKHAPETKTETYSDIIEWLNMGIEDLDHEL